MKEEIIAITIILFPIALIILPDKYNPLYYLRSHPAKIVTMKNPLTPDQITLLNEMGYIVDSEKRTAIRIK